jgi:hypothetical protein
MITEGVDYAWARPGAAGLAAAGKRFAVRYGGPGSAGKQLDAAELRALRAAGLDVVANAEGTDDGYLGAAAGRSWALAAEQHFRDLGMPADRPIYFSVDFDADSSDWAAVDAALRGSAEIIGAGRVGVYGSYDTIAHCVAAGTARWFWQTYAWSGGRWHSRAHIQQYKNGVSLAGGTVDLNRAMVADFGQWGASTGDDMTVADVRTGLAQVADEAANGSTSTGRQFRDDLRAIIAPTVNAAVAPITAALAAVLDGADKDEILARIDAKVAELAAQVGQVDEEVWAKVPDPGVTAAEKAALLRAVLGDDAAAVGALLQG